MKKIAALAISMAMLAMAVPATADTGEDIREQNREWLLEQNPNYNPNEIVEVHHNGIVEQMTAEDALDITLDRAGDKLLENIAADAGGSGGGTVAGDVWLIGFGSVDCGSTTVLAPTPYPFTPIHTQLWLYGASTGYNEDSSANFWFAISWTAKTDIDGSGVVDYGGDSDFFCIEGGFFSLLFPFIDGYATNEQDVPP